MKRLAELVVLPWLILALTVPALLLYLFAPRQLWLVMFAFVIWWAHWLRRDES